MKTINISNLHTQKDVFEAEAGKVGKALAEWGAAEGQKLHQLLVGQQELVAQAKQGFGSAKTQVSTRQSETTEASQVFDATLAGAVALMKVHHLGEVPAQTDYYKADRYAFADLVVERLESEGPMGNWLAKSLRSAKAKALTSAEKQREASAAFEAAGRGYLAAVGRLKLLVLEAKVLLRSSLPGDAPPLRHIKRQKKEPASSGTGTVQKPAA